VHASKAQGPWFERRPVGLARLYSGSPMVQLIDGKEEIQADVSGS